jgi:hypothetical protein
MTDEHMHPPEWSVLLSPAPALANILGVRVMQSPQPESGGISRILSPNERGTAVACEELRKAIS